MLDDKTLARVFGSRVVSGVDSGHPVIMDILRPIENAVVLM